MGECNYPPGGYMAYIATEEKILKFLKEFKNKYEAISSLHPALVDDARKAQLLNNMILELRKYKDLPNDKTNEEIRAEIFSVEQYLSLPGTPRLATPKATTQNPSPAAPKPLAATASSQPVAKTRTNPAPLAATTPTPVTVAAATATKSPSKITDLDPKVAAAELKRYHLQLISKIELKEFDDLAWTKDKTKHQSPNINILIEQYNQLSNKVRDEILLSTTPEEQAKVFEFYVKLMDESVKANDYHGAQAIMSCLTSAPIRRLEHLKDADPKIAKLLQKNEVILSPLGNFKNARKEAGSPINALLRGAAISPFPALNQDLIFAYEGNLKDFKITEEGKKIYKRSVDEFKNQQAKTNLELEKAKGEPQADIGTWLKGQVLNEVTAFERSQEVFPRGGQPFVPKDPKVPIREPKVVFEESAKRDIADAKKKEADKIASNKASEEKKALEAQKKAEAAKLAATAPSTKQPDKPTIDKLATTSPSLSTPVTKPAAKSSDVTSRETPTIRTVAKRSDEKAATLSDKTKPAAKPSLMDNVKVLFKTIPPVIKSFGVIMLGDYQNLPAVKALQSLFIAQDKIRSHAKAKTEITDGRNKASSPPVTDAKATTSAPAVPTTFAPTAPRQTPHFHGKLSMLSESLRLSYLNYTVEELQSKE